jgi:hypothetical protein
MLHVVVFTWCDCTIIETGPFGASGAPPGTVNRIVLRFGRCTGRASKLLPWPPEEHAQGGAGLLDRADVVDVRVNVDVQEHRHPVGRGCEDGLRERILHGDREGDRLAARAPHPFHEFEVELSGDVVRVGELDEGACSAAVGRSARSAATNTARRAMRMTIPFRVGGCADGTRASNRRRTRGSALALGDPGHSPGLDTAGAGVHPTRRTVDEGAHALHVRVPSAVVPLV